MSRRKAVAVSAYVTIREPNSAWSRQWACTCPTSYESGGVKRFLFLFGIVSLCTIAVAGADEIVRQAQTRLKDGGFYFGEVHGRSDSETSAAVTRYQIRNGLPITGRLDDETMKSLRISGKTAAAAAGDRRETWRQLRRADERFLRNLNERETANPRERAGGEQLPPRAVQPPRAERRPVVADTQTLVLSRERLRDYVAAFVLAGLDSRVGAELEFFADRVNYFNRGPIPKEEIRRDLQRYNQRWPQRRFWLAGDVQVHPQRDSLLRVTFPLRYELRSPTERASGTVRKTLLVEVTGDDLQIVSVDERKSR
jgi:hypothetical protein